MGTYTQITEISETENKGKNGVGNQINHTRKFPQIGGYVCILGGPTERPVQMIISSVKSQ